MKQTTIAILLSIMFTALTVAPDIVVLIDYDYDVSILIDANEEEERKGKERKGEEKVKDFEVEIPKYEFCGYLNSLKSKENLSSHYLDNYSSIYKELTSPPPKLNI